MRPHTDFLTGGFQQKSLLRRLSPDKVALEPPTERDNEQLRRPLGARRVLQEDQARHCAAEITRKSCNLKTSEQRQNEKAALRKNAKSTNHTGGPVFIVFNFFFLQRSK